VARLEFLARTRRQALRIAVLTLGAVSLSACAYGDYGGYGGVSVGVGSGFAGGYDPYCDGFSAWDSWYGCDAGFGFGQIGYGGGYWDNFYYPGYGTWIFDRPGGRRFAMQDRHRRYWAQQRWQYQQQRRGDRRDDRFDRRNDRRDDRFDRRQDRRETLDDRRDWRREQRTNNPEFPRTRRGERERMGGLTPEDRQRRLERWEQRQQEQLGQPRQNRRGGEGRGGGRGRPDLGQPGGQVQPGVSRPPRAERAPRPDRAPQIIERPRPRGPAGVANSNGVRPQDVRED
jgi:hypothetical protein